MALSDSEISALLPDDDKRKINTAFEALSQTMPTHKEQAILYRVVHSLNLQPTDSIFSFLAATHLYYQLYQAMPAKIIQAGDLVTDKILKTIEKVNLEKANSSIREDSNSQPGQAKKITNSIRDDLTAIKEVNADTKLKSAGELLRDANSLLGDTNKASAAAIRTNKIICVCSIFSSAFFFCLGLYFGKYHL